MKKMKTIAVIGLGRFGSSVAEELFRKGHEVLVMDERDELVQEYSSKVTYAVAGDARDENVLKTVGIKNFDCVIIAVGNIESSAIIALTLQNMGVSNIVCKASHQLHAKLLDKIGVTRVIQPERDMGKRVALSLSSDTMMDIIELSGSHSIAETRPPVQWVGKTIKDLNVRAKYGVSIMAVRSGECGKIEVSPGAEYMIHKDDVLILVGRNEDLDRLQRI